MSCEYNKEASKWEITAKDFEQFAMAISPSSDPQVRQNTALNRLKNLNSSLHFVKGINGDMIPTESVYSAFIKHLREYTTIYNDREYINTSLVGAQIDGYKNMSLEEALIDSEPVGNIELESNFELDRNIVFNNLKNKLSELKSAIPMIEEGLRLCKNINNELRRNRNANSDVLKLLKKFIRKNC